MQNWKQIDRLHDRVVELIRDARLKSGLSMTQLAEQAGLSQSMISYIESRSRKPTLDTLLRIATVLNINLSTLIREAERET